MIIDKIHLSSNSELHNKTKSILLNRPHTSLWTSPYVYIFSFAPQVLLQLWSSSSFALWPLWAESSIGTNRLIGTARQRKKSTQNTLTVLLRLRLTYRTQWASANENTLSKRLPHSLLHFGISMMMMMMMVVMVVMVFLIHLLLWNFPTLWKELIDTEEIGRTALFSIQGHHR